MPLPNRPGGKVQLSERLRNMRFMRQSDESDLRDTLATQQRQRDADLHWTVEPAAASTAAPSTAAAASAASAAAAAASAAATATTAATDDNGDDGEHPHRHNAGPEAADLGDDADAPGPPAGLPLVIVEDSFANPQDAGPLSAHCGRQSFGNFNAVVERRNRTLNGKPPASSQGEGDAPRQSSGSNNDAMRDVADVSNQDRKRTTRVARGHRAALQSPASQRSISEQRAATLTQSVDLTHTSKAFFKRSTLGKRTVAPAGGPAQGQQRKRHKKTNSRTLSHQKR